MEEEKEYLTANEVIQWFLDHGVNCHRRTLTRWISNYNGPRFTWGNNGEMWYRAKDLPEWVSLYNEQLKITKRKSTDVMGRKKIYFWLTADNHKEIKGRTKKEKVTMTTFVRQALELRMGEEYECINPRPRRPKKEVPDKAPAKPVKPVKIGRPPSPCEDEAELIADGFVVDRPLLRRIKKAALKVKLTPNEALTTALNYWLVDVEDA